MGGVGRALYRALLRWTASHAGGAPFTLSEAELRPLFGDAASAARLVPTAGVTDVAGVRALVRAAFRAPPPASDADASAALDAAFAALRHANERVAPLLAARAQLRESRANRDGVRFSVGDVFRHKSFGYTGVLTGWDRVCARDPAWCAQYAANLPHGTTQPFYYALPDVRDCVALFGGPRDSKYVAQDNVELLSPAAAPAASPPPAGSIPPPPRARAGLGRRDRILHQSLSAHFVGFNPSTGRYVPNRALAFEFPDPAYGEGGGGGGGGSVQLEPLGEPMFERVAGALLLESPADSSADAEEAVGAAAAGGGGVARVPCRSERDTHGLRVEVASRFAPHLSGPDGFAFSYTVRFTNTGASTPLRLRSRTWLIADAAGGVQAVRGPGVVGETPTLRPNGGAFEYTSHAVVPTPTGVMSGGFVFEVLGGEGGGDVGDDNSRGVPPNPPPLFFAPVRRFGLSVDGADAAVSDAAIAVTGDVEG